MIALRTATLDDVDAIMAIETASFGLTAWTRDTMARELASEWGRYVVAVDDAGAVVGYVGLRAVGVEGDIQTIAVGEAARGTGLGRRLLAQAQQDARDRGVQELFLEVREDNAPARALYASEGFVEIGVRPGYYQPEGVDAISMRKELA
ncbi:MULTISPECIES: ribosomal protein S18-alanine N-acetyltransferase [unclassified Agrococcus]|uniref:ribosomal protein S18-alanine N-acetyltransferase n=1 Tax=unclassified Agrococcus TaxID=2615065 RepID=UPI0036243CC6